MSENIKCIIVDDEPLGREVVANFCEYFPNLEIVGLCANALEARNCLKDKHVDLIFLDIQMPVLDGMSFFRTLKSPPSVIFTTAYKEHASQAFDVEAIDYLVKPFSLDRFMVAVDRFTTRQAKLGNPAPAKNVTGDADGHIFIRSEGKIFKYSYNEILYAEANGNYTNIITQNGVVSPTITFARFHEQLSETLFIQVHRSFIINRSKINHIEGNMITIGRFQIPIGSYYKEAFLKSIGLSL